MEKIIQITYSQIVRDDRLLEISQESASIYNKALHTFASYQEKNNGKWLSKFDLQKEMSIDYKRTLLHSDSYIAALQQYHSAMVSTKEALKTYKKYPDRFTGEPKYPSKDKTSNCITFKQKAIKVKDNYLFLSLAQGNDPIKIRWNSKLGTPIFAIVGYYPTKGWMGHFVFEKSIKQVEDLTSDKTLAIDLGIRRIATIFDGTKCITFSGNKLRSIIRHREKSKSDYQSKMDICKKHSGRWKKLNTSKRRKTKRISDKINDILHKTSRTIVNYAIENKIPKIVIGDNASTHVEPDTGKVNNQLITQGVEQKLRKLVQFKFESIGGITEVISEAYTSKTCPQCGALNSTKKTKKKSSRTYICKKCKFVYDRDGVGSVNIWGLDRKVSLGQALGVIGALTAPIGWKYHPSHKCTVNTV